MHTWEDIKMEWMKTTGDKTGLEILTTKNKKKIKENFQTGTGNDIPKPQRQQEETVLVVIIDLVSFRLLVEKISI